MDVKELLGNVKAVTNDLKNEKESLKGMHHIFGKQIN